MKNKGFVLMETIVVIVVISVALLTIFSSYNKILNKVKTENKFDTSEYIYMTNYIKNYLQKDGCNITVNDIFPDSGNSFVLTELYSSNACDIKIQNEFTVSGITKLRFPIEKIYIVTNINKFDKELSNGKKNSEYFDAYMIDYLRKLDVSDTDELIIIEYKRPSMNKNYDQRKLVSGYVTDENKLLSETYIASLEW